MDDKKKLILQSPLFEGISLEELGEIFRVVKRKVLSANSVVFRQGDVGDRFFILCSGKARVFRKGKNNEKIDLAILGPGDSIGEMSLLTGERRSAYLKTIEETELLVLTKAQFDHVLAKYPNVTKAFINKMSEKLVLEREVQAGFKVPIKPWLGYIVIIVVSLMFGLIFNQTNPNGIAIFSDFWPEIKNNTVGPLAAKTKYDKGNALLIDARPAVLFDQAHIEGALNIPLNIFDVIYMMELSEINKRKNVIIYGRTISRHYDKQLARKLTQRGFIHVEILKGGLSEWKKKGLPVEVRYNR